MTSVVVRSFYDIPGWFRWIDMITFKEVLDVQADSDPGVLIELGTYLGKSAVVIGEHLRDGDRFVALDLFGDADELDDSSTGQANRRENEGSYRSLTRQQFEQNYLSLHDVLPEVVQAESSRILEFVEPGTARFIHIDASHLYAQVHIDAVNAKTLLRPGGVVVFDDYRSEHTPGVSAAVWQAIISDGLIPIALTPAKLYGVYDDPQPYHDALHHRFSEDPGCRFRIENILDRQVLHARPAPRPASPKPPPPPPPAIDADALSVQVADRAAQLLIQRLSDPSVVAAPKPVRVPDVAPATSLGRLRRSVARNLAPPALTRWALARRRERVLSSELR